MLIIRSGVMPSTNKDWLNHQGNNTAMKLVANLLTSVGMNRVVYM